jgi:hypothetical protein
MAMLDMDRLEIVVCTSNEDFYFGAIAKNGLWASKWLKWERTAGSQFTFKRPLSCPKKGILLKGHI